MKHMIESAINGTEIKTMHDIAANEIRRRTALQLQDVIRATRLLLWSRRQMEKGKMSLISMLRFNRQVLDRYKIGKEA